MKTLYMLVGVPGSGKSTWIANRMGLDWNTTVVASTDNYIERVAKERGTTYSGAFKDAYKPAEQNMYKSIADAVEKGYDIIWDQTNISAKSRADKLSRIPDDYKKIAVFFSVPEKAELDSRLAGRVGKNIPADAVSSMIKNLEMPSRSEGFDEIIEV